MSPVEETHQDIEAAKLDLVGVKRDPAYVGRYRTSNWVTRALAHLVGTDGRQSNLVGADKVGGLFVRGMPLTEMTMLALVTLENLNWATFSAWADYFTFAGYVTAPTYVMLNTGPGGSVTATRVAPGCVSISHKADDSTEWAIAGEFWGHVNQVALYTDGTTMKVMVQAYKLP